ncbi:MAG: SPOR domain-containing protein [Bacteroidota bacterium]
MQEQLELALQQALKLSVLNKFQPMRTVLFKYFILAFVTLLFASYTHAQNKFVQVQSDVKLDTLINRNIEANKTANTIQGFRIQIFFGSERKNASDARSKVLQLFPDADVYLIYQQPYFKVRVGDYRTKLEAHHMFTELLPQFDKIFIVPDKINLPKL